jgi:tetratricopeptide (TPR) repeat protein
MEEDDAIDLLLRAAFLDESSTELRLHAKNIVKELSYLALAVDQAGAVIASGFCGVQDYLKRYKTRRKELLAFPPFKGASNYDKAVFNTWDVSFQAMKHKSRASDSIEAKAAANAILLLQTFAMFHYENIMEEIFRRCAEEPRWEDYTKEEDPNGEMPNTSKYLPLQLLQLDKDGKWEPFDFRDGIRMLLSFSLIKPDASGSFYSVHPLVHFWTRENMSKATRQDHCCISTATLCSSINTGRNACDDYTFRRKLIPHINAYLKHVVELSLMQPYFSDKSHKYGWVFLESGHWREAEDLFVQAMETSLRVLGQEHPSTLTSMANLASTYRNQGRWKEAEELFVQVMETSLRVRGQEHPDSLTSVNNLAGVLRAQGKYEVAEEMHRRALEGREKVLGVEHPSTLTSIDNLASVLRYQGKYAAAEEMDRRALEGREKALGKEHPDTLNSIDNLAATLRNLGKYKAAEAMAQRALDGRENVLGKEHPDTLQSACTLAVTLWCQGKYEAAEAAGRRALEGRERVLGKEHPDTLHSVYSLACTVRGQGKHETAEAMHRRALKGRERILGKEHPDTLWSVYNLAYTLKDQGKHEAAEAMHRQALEGRERVLGKEHPHTLWSVFHLAYTLGD